MNEYAPKRLHGITVALMFSGYSVGDMVAASLGIGLIPNLGWQPMLFVAAVPLLPLILCKLPESLGFLIRQGKQDDAKRIFARIHPQAPLAADDQLIFAEAKGPRHQSRNCSATRPTRSNLPLPDNDTKQGCAVPIVRQINMKARPCPIWTCRPTSFTTALTTGQRKSRG